MLHHFNNEIPMGEMILQSVAMSKGDFYLIVVTARVQPGNQCAFPGMALLAAQPWCNKW